MNTDEFPFKGECYDIIGACMEVSNELGSGFLEAVYQEALCYEFADQGIPFENEKVLDVYFKGRLLKKKYVADFICFGEVILEIKAIDTLHPEHTAQVLNYLKATGKKIGLLVNFGTSKLQYKRVIR
ncbi:MAG: GxxExxY protein [Bacteroidota bacterium]|nr:GxxExxY protein [Bacteroidota bacterium]